MRVLFEGIEPFGGLREDIESNIGWNSGVKKRFISVKREPGVYMYHKSNGVPSCVLFLVNSLGTAHSYIAPSYDNNFLNVYIDLTSYDQAKYNALTLYRYSEDPRIGGGKLVPGDKGIYYRFKSDIEKSGNKLTVLSFLKSSAFTTKDLKNKYINKKEFIEYKEKYLKIHSDDIKVLQDSDWAALSKDCGIVSPDLNRSGTVITKLITPTDETLLKLGYTTNISPISENSNENDQLKYSYNDSRQLGKAQHDLATDMQNALEASKSVKIGWASHPEDLK